MTKLIIICYIDNGKAFTVITKSQTMSMRANTLALVATENSRDSGRMLCEIFEETGLQATKMEMKGIITFPEFTPGHDCIRMCFSV